MSIKLNLGSGKEKIDGYIGIDILPIADIQRNLEKQCLPFDNDSVEEIVANSFLEHVDNLFFILDECHRVLQKGGILNVVVPNGLYIAPDHKRYFTKKTFEKYITTGPSYYSFSENKWSLKSYKESGEGRTFIEATLIPIKVVNRPTGNMLNLGCGSKHKPGYINVDYTAPADVIFDISRGLPFSDDTMDRIEADNLMEHFDNYEFMFVMNECWRVLKKDGTFWMKVPDALNWMDGAFGDPTHKRFFVPRSFLYFNKDSDTWRVYGKSYGFKPWLQIKLETNKLFFEGEFMPYK